MVSESSFPFAFTINPPPLGQCAGGMHPTGMHSCHLFRFSYFQICMINEKESNLSDRPVIRVENFSRVRFHMIIRISIKRMKECHTQKERRIKDVKLF